MSCEGDRAAEWGVSARAGFSPKNRATKSIMGIREELGLEVGGQSIRESPWGTGAVGCSEHAGSSKKPGRQPSYKGMPTEGAWPCRSWLGLLMTPGPRVGVLSASTSQSLS